MIIALSLFITKTIFGASAFLTRKKENSISFKIMAKDDLKIEFVWNKESKDVYPVVPGEKFDLDLGVRNDSIFPVYLFAQVNIDAAILHTGENINNFVNPNWEPLENVGNNIFYYAKDEKIAALTGTSKEGEEGEMVIFLDYIKIKNEGNHNINISGKLSVTLYAIQSAGFDDEENIGPKDVWDQMKVH